MSTDEQTFTATRAELLDALTHLYFDIPWPPPVRRDGTVAVNAETMADSIIEALCRRRQRIVHHHWPPQCGLPAVPDGDIWSGNVDLVTCPACLVRTEPTIGIRDEAEEFGFGRNAAPPWEQPAS